MRTWNKADAALLLSAVLFLCALFLHIRFADFLWVRALLAVSEAALVGGVADWFAVTAIFRKPLGFPYHTALLPRRRDSFVQAIVTMVQKEFFSKRKIFHHMEQMHLFPMIENYLRRPTTEEQLTGMILHFIRASFLRRRNSQIVSYLASRLRDLLLKEDPAVLMQRLDELLREKGWDKKALTSISRILVREAATEETYDSIRNALEQLEREKIGDGFLSRILTATNTINLDEGAELIQQHTCHVLEELGRDNSPLQNHAANLIHDALSDLERDEELATLVRELQKRLAETLPIDASIERILSGLRTHVQADLQRDVDPMEEHMPAFYQQLRSILHAEYQRMLTLLTEHSDLQQIMTRLMYDLIARSALHAQALVGIVVSDALMRLTDEELNRLVYDKVEQDFLWIRVNGSLVGGCIGLLLFLGTQMFR